jgi:hypothetical protein
VKVKATGVGIAVPEPALFYIKFTKIEMGKTKKKPPKSPSGGLVETHNCTSLTEKPKSKTALFREKYPEGIGYIVNMRAVLK